MLVVVFAKGSRAHMNAFVSNRIYGRTLATSNRQ